MLALPLLTPLGPVSVSLSLSSLHLPCCPTLGLNCKAAVWPSLLGQG